MILVLLLVWIKINYIKLSYRELSNNRPIILESRKAIVRRGQLLYLKRAIFSKIRKCYDFLNGGGNFFETKEKIEIKGVYGIFWLLVPETTKPSNFASKSEFRRPIIIDVHEYCECDRLCFLINWMGNFSSFCLLAAYSVKQFLLFKYLLFIQNIVINSNCSNYISFTDFSKI